MAEVDPAPRVSYRILAGVWLLALVVRLVFTAAVLAENSPERISEFHFDSAEYLQLARHWREQGRYTGDTPTLRFFALLRTPGYPAIIAIAQKAGLDVAGLLYMQAAIGSLIPVGVCLLAHWIFRSARWAAAAGILSALSTTGIGLGAIVLADLPLAAALLAGVVLLAAGAAHGRSWAWLAAGVALAGGVLIKPAIVYIGPVLLGAWWMLARAHDRPMRWGAALWVVGAPIVAVCGWMHHNHTTTGQWVFATVDAQNLRHFLAPQTQEYARAGGFASSARVYENHRTVVLRELAEVHGGRIAPAELARRQKVEATAIVSRDPGWAACAVGVNLLQCAGDHWAWVPMQLPRPTALRYAMEGLNVAQAVLRWPMYALAALMALESRRAKRMHGESGTDPFLRERRWLGALALVLLYFLGICGTSFQAGFRILYPAEFAMILLALGGVRAALRWRGSFAKLRTGYSCRP